MRTGKSKKIIRLKISELEAKINFLNQIKIKNLDFNFDINQNIYKLKKIEMKLNDTKIISPLVEIKEKKNLFFINGQFLNDKKTFDIKEFKPIFTNLPNNIDIKKIEFSSKNNFSFNISKNLKFDNFKVK